MGARPAQRPLFFLLAPVTTICDFIKPPHSLSPETPRPAAANNELGFEDVCKYLNATEVAEEETRDLIDILNRKQVRIYTVTLDGRVHKGELGGGISSHHRPFLLPGAGMATHTQSERRERTTGIIGGCHPEGQSRLARDRVAEPDGQNHRRRGRSLNVPKLRRGFEARGKREAICLKALIT